MDYDTALALLTRLLMDQALAMETFGNDAPIVDEIQKNIDAAREDLQEYAKIYQAE